MSGMDVELIDTSSVKKKPWSDADSYLRSIFESALLLLAISFLEPILFGDGHYSTFAFHPFWIVVLLASLQYGLYGGVTAACMASLLMEWPPRPLGVDIAQHYFELASLPLHWLLAALMLGTYRNIQLGQMRRLGKEVSRLSEVNSELAEEVRLMDTSLAHAELALVTREDPGAAVLDALHKLYMCDSSEDDIRRLLVSAAKVATGLPAALLLPDKNGSFADRDPNSALASLTLTSNSPLIEKLRVQKTGSFVWMGEILEDQDGYLAYTGVRAQGTDKLIAIVALVASDKAAAEAAVASVEVLGIAVDVALHSFATSGLALTSSGTSSA